MIWRELVSGLRLASQRESCPSKTGTGAKTARTLAGMDGSSAGNLIYAAARDATEQKFTEEAQQERLRFEELVSALSARFVNIPPEQVDAEIEYGLRQVLEFFQVDRAGLLRALRVKTHGSSLMSLIARMFRPSRGSEIA